eukprot:TRINITY_DN2719_c0_g2_i1.p3 TRINITY_DN2719_c0_g2~~TRINITY_DN2719_c0_g2_i1.p3  ORF type:complete len:172 (-),score=50.39 TRINITY_DN2719_c0_g2_i1:121-636(-)
MMVEPDNPMSTVIGDFGFAKQFGSQTDNTSTMLGTNGYMPPEIHRQAGAYNGFQADMFSMGVILYELLVKKPPWALSEGADPAAWNNKPDEGDRSKFPSKYGWDAIDASAKELVKSLLQMDPSQRPNTTQVLWDDWMTGALGVEEFRAVTPNTPRGEPPKIADAGGCCVLC